MPTRKDPFDPQRRADSGRMPSKQQSQGMPHENETPPPHEPSTSPGEAASQGPLQKRLNLVTLPTDRRYLRGRY